MSAATLENLLENNNSFRLTCNQCGRTAMMDVPGLIKTCGQTMELPEIGKRSRCIKCGGKGASVTVVAEATKTISKLA